jgi:hypothetical protein
MSSTIGMFCQACAASHRRYAIWCGVTSCFLGRRSAVPWDVLTERVPIERACKTMVALLDIAYCSGREAELAEQIEHGLNAGELPDPTVLRSLFVDEAHNSRGTAGPPMVSIVMPTAPTYDVLLPATCGWR